MCSKFCRVLAFLKLFAVDTFLVFGIVLAFLKLFAVDAFLIHVIWSTLSEGLAKSILKEKNVDFDEAHVTKKEAFQKLSTVSGGLHYHQMKILFYQHGVSPATFLPLSRQSAQRLVTSLTGMRYGGTGIEGKGWLNLLLLRLCGYIMVLNCSLFVQPGLNSEQDENGMVSIYKITCLCNGKVYIGKNSNVVRRFRQHMRCPVKKMQDDVARFGKGSESFCVEELVCCPEAVVAEYEKWFILLYMSTVSGFNNLSGYPESQRKYWFLTRRNKLR